MRTSSDIPQVQLHLSAVERCSWDATTKTTGTGCMWPKHTMMTSFKGTCFG